MKNRKRIVVAFLLCAVMLLGIGYATLTDVLEVSGSADVDATQATEAFNEDIYFSKAVAKEDGNIATIVTGDPDMATFTIKNLKGKDDTATFVFTITNDGDVDALVTPTLAENGNTNTEYFHIESTWQGQPRELAAGASIEYEVTVTLLKTPTEYCYGSFRIILTATSQDKT